MSTVELTNPLIRQLCGLFAYEEGEARYREGLVTIKTRNPAFPVYEAEVEGTRIHSVSVELRRSGKVEAACTCPDYHPADYYCKHIAAVLLQIKDLQHHDRRLTRLDVALSNAEQRSSDSDKRLTDGILSLFESGPQLPSGARANFETRIVLDVAFTVKTIPYGDGTMMFGIELKLGPKRLYAVQRIRELLDRIERREPFTFSAHFEYDPGRHCFRPEDDAVIRQLIDIRRSERMVRDSSHAAASDSHRAGGDRILPVLPYTWDRTLPLLASAPSVRLEHDGGVYDGLHISDGPLPLSFAFDEADDGGYRLEIDGLDGMTVMESYGVVLAGGMLMRPDPGTGSRLSELKRLLEPSRSDRIRIPKAQMEPFLEKVVPGLTKLGKVGMSQAVSDRILHMPLQARLYLDRVKDKLLAGLEFQYGDIVVNPLESAGEPRGESRILMRDGEKERRILALLEQDYMAKTESGFYMDDEDAEYDFLYHVLPELEKLLDVYATSAVKVRIHVGPIAPVVHVDVDERTDWLEIKFDISGIPEADIRKVLQSLEEKRRYYRMPDGALLPLESEAFREIVRFMNEMGARKGDLNGSTIRLPSVRGLHLAQSPPQGTSVKLGKSLRRLLDNLRNPDNLEFPIPETLAPVLRDYQKFGYQWLKTLAYYGFGGILADDMGLGKTLQSLAFLLSVLPEIRERRQPALIVCPASLLYNWQNEIKRFAPEIRAVIADGSLAARSAVLNHSAETADAVITSYPLLRRDAGRYAGMTFHTLILDEAQTFKNHATQTARAVKGLHAGCRFALTGTPVENRLEELWSIYDAVFPGLFPGRQAFNELPRETVARRIRPFMLRRLKSDVLKELPEKIETVQASELLPDQKKLYLAYLAKLRQDTLKHLDREQDGFRKNRIRILAGLTRLRQLICHPALFVEDYNGSSAKLEQLLELVEECRSAGRRLLVFSQFTEMLGMIGRELGYRGVPFFYLDGQTPASERVELCGRFNEGERDLFLVSLKAGGTGLNLTGADTVILYDLWWNPAVEQQAADRAHRIGQKKVVQVLRLVAQGTVEDKMYELQERKKNLIDEVIRPGEDAFSSLTEEDVREILML